MKLEILKDFRDKLTNEVRKAGEVVEFEAGRAKELLSNPGGFVKAAQDAPEFETAENKPVKKSKKAAKK